MAKNILREVVSVPESPIGQLVFDWVSERHVGYIGDVVKEAGKIVSYEVVQEDGARVEYPVQQLQPRKEGGFWLLPTWLAEAFIVIDQLEEVANHLQELQQLVEIGKITGEMHEDVLRAFISGAFSLLSRAERIRRNLERRHQELMMQRRREREEVVRILAEIALGSVDREVGLKTIEELRSRRAITERQLSDVERALGKLHAILSREIFARIFPGEQPRGSWGAREGAFKR